MLVNDQKPEMNEASEKILPYGQLRVLVQKILGSRVSRKADAEDISQDVFRRSWQWAKKNDRTLSETEWKSLIAKITFNEINRFYSKKPLVLTDDHLDEDQEQLNPDNSIISPQLILEIAEALRKLSFRQKLSLVLHDGEILPYLKVVLSQESIADLLEIEVKTLNAIENEIPLPEWRIAELIEFVTDKECRSSIRDERCKGRKLLKRRLFKL